MYHPANTNTDLAALAKKILDVNQTHFMITARPRLASRDFVSLNLNAVVWSYGMTNIQHEIQEGGRQAVAVSLTTILFFVISLAWQYYIS